MASRTKATASAIRRRSGEDDLRDEPNLTLVTEPSDTRMIRALNYYNLVDIKDKKDIYRRWVVEYAETHGFTAEEIGGIRRMEDWRITNSMATVSRLVSRGCSLYPQALEAHEARIREAVSRYAATRRKPKSDKQLGPTSSLPSDWSFTKATMDDMWDQFFWDSGERFSAYDYMVSQQVSTKSAALIARDYSGLVTDFRDLQRGDRFMKEAYPKLSRQRINTIVEQAESIVRDAERYALNQKKAVVRKPRKRKEKSASDQVKGVTYLKAFPALQLVSTDPAFIVGARQVWLYSTKYKTLRHLVGDELSVKGSTIHGWDPERSAAKALRKPEQVLSEVLKATSVTMKKILPGLKTKPQAVNGRLNGETIIVRALK